MFDESIKIKWQGEEYDCHVTMGLIKKMERSGINILQTALQIDKGGIPPVSLVAEFYAFILQSGGCEVTEEEIYESIMSEPQNSAALVASARAALRMFFPGLESPERTSKAVKKK